MDVKRQNRTATESLAARPPLPYIMDLLDQLAQPILLNLAVIALIAFPSPALNDSTSWHQSPQPLPQKTKGGLERTRTLYLTIFRLCPLPNLRPSIRLVCKITLYLFSQSEQKEIFHSFLHQLARYLRRGYVSILASSA